MAANSKLKLLYILDIMKKTDEYHPINSTQMAARLEEYGITAERKSIARDVACLEDAGYSIIKCADHNRGWYMTDQTFEDYELKILCDAVAAAGFLTDKDSRELISKVRGLATAEGESLIAAASVFDPAVKSEDRTNKHKIDTVIRAIKGKWKITFQYYEQGPWGDKRLRREGHVYRVSPYYLVLQENQYFLICTPDSRPDNLTHFRLEMMTNISMTYETVRSPELVADHGENFSVGAYLRSSPNMWAGERVQLMLRGENYIRDNVRRQFGNQSLMSDDGPDHFVATVEASDTTGLYQWLAGCGTRLKVLGPLHVRQKYTEYLRNMLEQYQ